MLNMTCVTGEQIVNVVIENIHEMAEQKLQKNFVAVDGTGVRTGGVRRCCSEDGSGDG